MVADNNFLVERAPSKVPRLSLVWSETRRGVTYIVPTILSALMVADSNFLAKCGPSKVLGLCLVCSFLFRDPEGHKVCSKGPHHSTGMMKVR